MMLAPIRRQHNLPASPTPLIGRECELRAAREQLLQEQVRLLTLTGPGGSGKTRLALAVAEELREDFPGGAWLVDLTPLRDPALVLPAIARVLGLQATGPRPIFETLCDRLRWQQLLLVLDNCEHVLAGMSEIAELLSACRGIKVLATSREPLRLRWEHELPVPPLATPDVQHLADATTLGTVPSVELFVQRARAVDPSFALTDENATAVAGLCVRLDGLPLALELAAARVKVLPVRAMLLRLEHSLSLLASGARDRPTRHRTLGETIGWSYDLLDGNEQAIFRRLSIFAESCDLAAAAAVRGPGAVPAGGRIPAIGSSLLAILGSLVDKSLLRREEIDQAEPRFFMLETIRAFAREQLQARGEANETARRHADYFLALAECAEPELSGPDQEAWLDRLDRERDNLRAAQRWAVAHHDAERVARLVASLWQFWWARADASDLREWIDAIVPLTTQASPTPTLARALHGAGLMAGALTEYATCRFLLGEALAVARRLDDRHLLATVLDSLGRQSFVEGRYADARVLLTECVAILRTIDDRHALARALSHLGFLDYLEGDQESARATYQEGLALARDAGDHDTVAEFLDNLGRTFQVEGDYDGAVRAYQEAEGIWREIGQGHRLAMVLNNLGSVQTLRGERDVARGQLAEALSLAQRIGNRRRQAFTLTAIASLAALEGEPERALCLDAVASAAVGELGASLAQPIHALGARHLDQARKTLGPAAASAATSSGQAMTLAQAVEETLTWLAEPLHSKQVGDASTVADRAAPTATPPSPDGTSTASVGTVLSPREREVAALVARGMTNRQIAEALVISPHTAERHVERILAKLNCSSRAEIAAWAVRHGLAET